MIFERALARFRELRGSIENPRVSLKDASVWMDLWGVKTAAGPAISEATALNISGVFAAVQLVANTVASLPFPVYRRLERGKERAPEHPLYRVLHDRANPEMSAFTYREVAQSHLELWGNHYAEIEMDGAGRVLALWPLLPDRTRPVRRNGAKIYQTRLPQPGGGDRQIDLPAERVLHIPGLGFDGLVGYSRIALARESLGLTRAAEEFGARFFGQGSQATGVLEHPGRLGEKAAETLRKSWEQMHQGLANAHRIAILEEGIKFHQTSIPPEDAQFLETRKFQTAEIARWFGVPPHLIGDLERATFSNIEQQAIEYLVHSIRPRLVRWEQTVNWDLLGPRERQQFVAEFLVAGLLRGDTQSRYGAYAVGRQWGWLSANDVRELENMNPVGGGDIYLVPANMASAEAAEESEPEPSGPARPFERLFRYAARRVVGRHLLAATKAARKDDVAFRAWLDEFSGEDEIQFAEEAFRDVVLAYAESLGLVAEGSPAAHEYVRRLAEGEVQESVEQLRRAFRDASTAEAELVLAPVLADWSAHRAQMIAHREIETCRAALLRRAAG